MIKANFHVYLEAKKNTFILKKSLIWCLVFLRIWINRKKNQFSQQLTNHVENTYLLLTKNSILFLNIYIDINTI